ncbi:MAG TPA: type II toxin-antitoxin system prevent-host-death family antitoxin [Thermoanaerobaculia bacterium]|jgi:prevent-host-death family protein
MAKRAFDLTEDIQPVADLQTQAEGLLRKVRDTGRPVVLTEEGKGTAVLVDIQTYQSLLDELDLLRDVQRGLADIEAGRVVPHDEARARLLDRYN